MMSNYQRMQWQRRRFEADRRRDDNHDISTAWHEAGHVLCGELLGLNPTSATINGGDGYSGKTYFGETLGEMTDHDLAYARAVVCMAGLEAQRLFGGPDDGGGDGDAGIAAIAIRAICRSEAVIDGIIESARRAACEMLKANFIPLCEIAIALLAERTLDRDQIEEIIAANAPEDDAGDEGNDDAELLPPSMFGDRILMRALDPRLVRYGTTGKIL
jgi:hypothetical protein